MGVAARIGKPINHRILLNEVPNIISRDEVDLIEQVDSSNPQRFESLIHRRAAYSKSFSRDTLPHLANPPDPKAIAEINNLMSEIYAIFNDTLQKAAA